MNLVFLSGPQGAGKTTLVELLRGPNILLPDEELETKTVKFDVIPEMRAALKICQRSLENYECYEIAKKNPEKIVIGNRCIYDQFAFNNVYFMRGWISEEHKERLDDASKILYIPELVNPYSIMLNPGFNVVMSHLRKRWETKEVKWREKDTEYIRLACKSYENFANNPKVLYIDHEIDLDSARDVDLIENWFEKNFNLLVN